MWPLTSATACYRGRLRLRALGLGYATHTRGALQLLRPKGQRVLLPPALAKVAHVEPLNLQARLPTNHIFSFVYICILSFMRGAEAPVADGGAAPFAVAPIGEDPSPSFTLGR